MTNFEQKRKKSFFGTKLARGARGVIYYDIYMLKCRIIDTSAGGKGGY